MTGRLTAALRGALRPAHAQHRAAPPAGHISIADTLTAAGHDLEALTEEQSQILAIVPAVLTTEDGTRIAGVVFQTDYDATQEYGLATLRRTLTGEDPRRVHLLPPAGPKRIRAAAFSDVAGFVLSTHDLTGPELAWGDPLTGDGADAPRYADSYRDNLPYIQGVGRGDRELPWRTMKDLRALADRVGVPSPRPKVKAGLIEAIRATDTYQSIVAAPRHPNRWPAWFPYGSTLVIRADAGPTRVIVERLADAVRAGTLAFGSYSGPFATGTFLYDARDETDAVVAARVEACDWRDARMADLQPVLAELKSRGHGWYALGRPTLAPSGPNAGQVRYWLNGHGGYVTVAGRRVPRQPFGWYTLEELLAEKFLDDLDERLAERKSA
jgi:hypothetical protein